MNIAEILKGASEGTRLYSTVFGDVELLNIFACLIGTLTWTTNNNYHCSEDIPKYMRWLENLKQRLNGTE